MPNFGGGDAPDFSLPDENGLDRKLSEVLGYHVELYFYPKINAPGVTTDVFNFGMSTVIDALLLSN